MIKNLTSDIKIERNLWHRKIKKVLKRVWVIDIVFYELVDYDQNPNELKMIFLKELFKHFDRREKFAFGDIVYVFSLLRGL